MRQFLPVFVAFTIGTLLAAVHYERELSDLKADAECNYHTGYDEGWRDASFTHIEEDDPRWDCHTMGNKRCGTVRNTR